jgi:hypothetical protein
MFSREACFGGFGGDSAGNGRKKSKKELALWQSDGKIVVGCGSFPRKGELRI